MNRFAFRLGVVALVFTVIALGIFWKNLASTGERSGVDRSREGASSGPLEARARLLARIPARSSTISAKELEQRIGLTAADAYVLRFQLRALHRQLLEQKGAQARVVRAEGAILELNLPPLALSERELLEQMLAQVEASVGPAAAERILADREALAALAEECRLEAILAETKLRFRRLSQGEFSPRESLRDLNKFEAWVEYAGRSSNLPRTHYREFTLLDMGAGDLSWSAAAKAPAGYFSAEPITKVAERMDPGVLVMRDLATGQTTVYSEDSPTPAAVLKPIVGKP